MFTSIDKFTDKLVQYGITAEQYFILYLVDTMDVPNLVKYMESNGKLNSRDIEVLIEKGYMVNSDPHGKKFDLGNLVVTLDYLEQEAKSIPPHEMYEQLLKEYPKFVEVNGTKYPSTGLSLADSKAAEELYLKKMKGKEVLHLEILSLIQKWKRNIGENAPFKIDKFITSEYWVELRNVTENVVRPRIH